MLRDLSGGTRANHGRLVVAVHDLHGNGLRDGVVSISGRHIHQHSGRATSTLKVGLRQPASWGVDEAQLMAVKVKGGVRGVQCNARGICVHITDLHNAQRDGAWHTVRLGDLRPSTADAVHHVHGCELAPLNLMRRSEHRRLGHIVNGDGDGHSAGVRKGASGLQLLDASGKGVLIWLVILRVERGQRQHDEVVRAVQVGRDGEQVRSRANDLHALHDVVVVVGEVQGAHDGVDGGVLVHGQGGRVHHCAARAVQHEGRLLQVRHLHTVGDGDIRLAGCVAVRGGHDKVERVRHLVLVVQQRAAGIVGGDGHSVRRAVRVQVHHEVGLVCARAAQRALATQHCSRDAVVCRQEIGVVAVVQVVVSQGEYDLGHGLLTDIGDLGGAGQVARLHSGHLFAVGHGEGAGLRGHGGVLPCLTGATERDRAVQGSGAVPQAGQVQLVGLDHPGTRLVHHLQVSVVCHSGRHACSGGSIPLRVSDGDGSDHLGGVHASHQVLRVFQQGGRSNSNSCSSRHLVHRCHVDGDVEHRSAVLEACANLRDGHRHSLGFRQSPWGINVHGSIRRDDQVQVRARVLSQGEGQTHVHLVATIHHDGVIAGVKSAQVVVNHGDGFRGCAQLGEGDRRVRALGQLGVVRLQHGINVNVAQGV